MVSKFFHLFLLSISWVSLLYLYLPQMAITISKEAKEFSQPLPLRGSADWVGMCGNQWQNTYTALHAAVLSGEKHPRKLVSVAVEAGIADRLSGLITQFLLALIQGRALQHIAYGNLPDWEVAYTFPHIASQSPPLADFILDCVKFTYRGVRGFTGTRNHDPMHVDPKVYFPLYLTNDYGSLTTIFSQSNLALVPEGHSNTETIVSASNRGRSFVLFDNPHHADKLRNMGLTPENAFACIHRFLFRLAPSACDTVCMQHAQILDNAGARGTLRIAIHVRVGDNAFMSNEEAHWRIAEAHFSCAEEIAATRTAPGQNVLFYFNSDSLPLRLAASERYGNKVLTDLRASGQTDCSFHGGCSSINASFRLAVAQLDLFSRADVHVVSIGSGYGAMGAWMSSLKRHGETSLRSRSRHIYRVINGEFRDCSLSAADDARSVAQGWAGF